jgi:hypothetical protein
VKFTPWNCVQAGAKVGMYSSASVKEAGGKPGAGGRALGDTSGKTKKSPGDFAGQRAVKKNAANSTGGTTDKLG